MHWRTYAAVAAVGLVAWAAPAWADDVSDLKSQVDALQSRLRQLENKSPSQDEIDATVARYLGSGPSMVLVGGADEGKAGFPMGKKPFIKEGPNKIEFAFRNQVRYEAFLYSDDAVGTLKNPTPTPPTFPLSDAAPRDRSGFEIERLYFGLDGTVFCEDITFKLPANFDSDNTTGVEKRYGYIDWKYSGEHHIRAGGDKAAYSFEENVSSGSLAFVDRSIVTKAFEIGFEVGVSAWGYFGGCDCPKNFFYKVAVSNGEGQISRGSVFNTDAFDTFSDQLLIAGMFEWNITCNDWKWDEVDHRPCDKRCKLDLSIGVSGYYENDDDTSRSQWGGLAVRGSGRAERYGLNAWVRAQYNGWSGLIEGYLRNIDYTAGSTSPEQEDTGAHILVHHRFADTNWGVGARAGIIWKEDNAAYATISTGPAPATVVALEDSITEFGVVVNYFFHDHNHKITADVNFVQDNSGVTSSSAGYLANRTLGVIVEDGIMLRIQWQLSL